MTLITSCPECNGELQASLTIYLKDITIKNGEVISYNIDHATDTTTAIAERVSNHQGDELTVYCENDHPFQLGVVDLPSRYQFQTIGGIGNDYNISADNLDSFVGLNTEHSLEEIQKLEVGQSLPYSTGALVRLADADPESEADNAAQDQFDATRMSGDPVNPESWYDYTNQAWVVDGAYATCGHDPAKPCCLSAVQCNHQCGDDCQGRSNCFGRVHAGETPPQNIIEQYCNVQAQTLEDHLTKAAAHANAIDWTCSYCGTRIITLNAEDIGNHFVKTGCQPA